MTPEERFSHALHNTARAWRLALDRRLKHLGLSQASWLAIAVLARDAPLSQTELAARLGVENPTMVAMIDRLVNSDFLVRVPSGTDRRVKLVGLTERGRQMHAQLRAVADPFRHELLGGIDPARLQAATALLEQLHITLEKGQ